jgi:uncharacterized protein (TIGR02118 family)
VISIFCLQSGGTSAQEVKPQTPDAVFGGRRQYLDNVVVDQSQLAIDYKRGSFDLTNILQLTYDELPSDVMSIHRQLSTDALGAETKLTMVTLQNTVIAPPENAKALKRMSLLQRRPDVDFETFQHEWFYLHGLLVKRLKGVVGYRQNLALSNFAGSSPAFIDGMVELWFEDAQAIAQAFQTDSGRTLMTHAKEFIGEITTFLVETRIVAK